MATLRTIRRRILAVQSTEKITQAMRMISAARLRRAQNNIESARPYALKLDEILSNLVSNIGGEYDHPLIRQPKETNNYLIISIASDRGLCGSFNHNLFRYEEKLEKDVKAKNPNAKFLRIAIGKRTVSHFKKIKAETLADYSDFFSNFTFEKAKEIVEIAKKKFFSGEADKVLLVFNEFKNVLTQRPITLSLLPIEAKSKEREKLAAFLDYIYEPEMKSILDELLPKYVDIQLWRSLLESFAAEQAARMVSMENATNNAKELIKHLELIYNKARQADITKEMLEIVGGAEALKNG